MVKILGEEFTRKELMRHFGDYKVAAGYKSYTLRDGRGEQIKICEINSGSGLRFEVIESRGMDIGCCYFKELPISYRSYNQDVHPSYYEAYEDGWLRSFSGGLLVCGGLTSMGSAQKDKGEILPLHGRISNIPAQQFHVSEKWRDDDLYFDIHGIVKETKALSYHLTLDRHILVKAGENRFTIHDIIRNDGFEDMEHMMLYHFNIGYPILDRDTRFYANSLNVEPRDDIAKNREDAYNIYLGPTPHYPDTVYYHDIQETNGWCKASIINHKRNIGFTLKYKKDTLDHFTQWKFTGEGNYVAGLEPCNARVNGRSIERDEGRLKVLKAQTQIEYEIEVSILNGNEEIKTYLREENLL